MAKLQSIPSRVVYYLTGFFGNGVFNVYTPYIREIINRLKFKFLSGNGETRLRNEILENLDKSKREKKRKGKIDGQVSSFNPLFRFIQSFRTIFPIISRISKHSCHPSVIDSRHSTQRDNSLLSFVEATSLIGLTRKYSGRGELVPSSLRVRCNFVSVFLAWKSIRMAANEILLRQESCEPPLNKISKNGNVSGRAVSEIRSRCQVFRRPPYHPSTGLRQLDDETFISRRFLLEIFFVATFTRTSRYRADNLIFVIFSSRHATGTI